MKVLFLFLSLFITIGVNAQQFFQPVKFKKQVPNRGAIAAAEPKAVWMFRPAIIGATLFVGETVEAVGAAGVAYQNISQKEGRAYVNYDIGIYMGAGGAIVAPSTNNADIAKALIVATALNGTVGLGYGFSRQENFETKERKWKGGLALVWKINFNN